MAAAALAAATPFSPSCRCSQRRPTIRFSSPLSALDSKNSNPRLHRSIPHLGLGSDPSWSGLKYFGVSSLRRFDQKKRKGQCRGRVVYASLFGVGAPEALVIGVVALLVFGPKGLAEVARNLGKTLRAFQPTIRELQDVSREFKSTLEREIGLDEVVSSTSNTYKSTSFANEKQEAVADPNGRPTTKAYTSDELLKITEDQLTASSIKPQTETSTPKAGPEEASATSEEVSASASGIAASPETAAQRPSSTERPENER